MLTGFTSYFLWCFVVIGFIFVLSNLFWDHLFFFFYFCFFLHPDFFSVLKKSRSKVDCLLSEMIFINELNPELNIQKDFFHAKLFT